MRRRRARWLGVAGLGVVMAGLLAGCAASAEDTAPPPALHLGGAVADGIVGEPGVLLPQLATSRSAAKVAASIWAPLFYSDAAGVIQPGLAEEVPSTSNGDVAPDGKTLTIRLRPGLRWSDGQPLTADDVVYTIGLLRDPAYGAQGGFGDFSVAGVAALDAYTVTIALGAPDATFLARGLTDAPTFAPLPKHIFGAMSAAALVTSTQAALPSVSSGPFVVTDRQTGQSITVTRNKHYYQAPKPNLDTITFRVFPDAPALLAALPANALDVASDLPVDAYSTLASLPGYALVPSTSASTYEALDLNLSNPALADVSVREALAIGFDPSDAIRDVWHQLATPTCDDAVGTFAHEPALVTAGGNCAYGPDGKTRDAGAANALLDKAGWLRGAGGERAKDGQPLTLRLAYDAGRPDEARTAQLVATAWSTLGVAVTLDPHAAADLASLLHPATGAGNLGYDVALVERTVGADPDDLKLFASGQAPQHGGENVTFYADAQVDGWLAQEAATADQEARAALFQEIHAQVLKDVPVIYLFATPPLSVARPSVQGYAPSGVGPSETWDVAGWWVGAANG